MPMHLEFNQMQLSAEAIAAQTLGDLTEQEQANGLISRDRLKAIGADFRHTLLLVFEEVSRTMPQEKVYDGIWESTFELKISELPPELGPLIPGTILLDGAASDFITPGAGDNKPDLFRGVFNLPNNLDEDLIIIGNRIANVVVLPITEQDILLRVQNIQIYRNSALLTGLATYSRIDEWDNFLFLYSGGQDGPAFDLQDGDIYRIWYESAWDLVLTDEGVPYAWPEGFPERIEENVLQGYIAHILLQQAAAAQASALRALVSNETSFTEEVDGVPTPNSLNGVLNELATVLGSPPNIDDHIVVDFPEMEDAVIAALPSLPAPTFADIEANPLFNNAGDLDSPVVAPTFDADAIYTTIEQPVGLENFPVVAIPSLTTIYASLTAARNAIVDLAALADLPDNTVLETYIQTGNDSVWSRLTAIRADLEGDTDLDPVNPDTINKSAWERLDQCLQNALSSLDSSYANAAGFESGLIPTGAVIFNANTPTSPRGYLSTGDNLINNVNIGGKAPELYPEYSQASLAIGRALVEAAATQNQQAIGLTNLASTYAQKIERYLDYAKVVLSEWENLSTYLQARASAVVQNNQAIVARGQGQAQIGLTKVNAIVEEIRARISSTELEVRVGQLAVDDRRSAREVHGRIQEVKGFLQTQSWQTQSQAYGNILQAITGVYRSRVEAATANYGAKSQAESSNYNTKVGGEVQVYTSKVNANVQAFISKTQTGTQTFVARLQAAGQKLENVVEAMLRRNEISNQYREIADRYQAEGQIRHDIYIRNLREKADAIRRRSRG